MRIARTYNEESKRYRNMEQRSVRVHLLDFFLRIKDHLLYVEIVNGWIVDGFPSINKVVVDDTSLSAAGKGAIGE